MARPEAEATGKQASLVTADGADAAPSAAALVRPVPKIEANEQYRDVPIQSTLARTSDAFSDRSALSSEYDNEHRSRRLLRAPDNTGYTRYPSTSPAPSTTWRNHLLAFWVRNKGLALVIISQFFGILMNVTTRLLEQESGYGPKMHPFQILFARMVGTLVLGFIYQWLAKVKDAPFGPRQVWALLVARGVGGFFGVYGVYYSLVYLPLSDATVITFLAPIVACWACSILIKEPFTRKEQIAAIVSFLGVVLIAQPGSLIPASSQEASTGGTDGGLASSNATTTASTHSEDHVTPAQRLSAVAVALIGVLGAACAYTTIRWIGQRAHPLISVNYLAVWSTIVSIVALLAIPSIEFRLPAGWVQWVQLIFLGICGFLMQFLLTAGLQYEKSSRATNMVYTQMLFAIAFDKLVWNSTPSLMSILGSSLILGSALYVAVLSNKAKDTGVTGERNDDEEQGLMQDGIDEPGGGDRSHQRGPLRGVQEVQLRAIRV